MRTMLHDYHSLSPSSCSVPATTTRREQPLGGSQQPHFPHFR